MPLPATPSTSGAWFPAASVRLACAAYMAQREASQARWHKSMLAEATRRRCLWAPWRQYTQAEAARVVGTPALRWLDILATSGLAADHQVGDLFSLALAAERAGAPVWLTAADAALLPALER